MPSRRLAIEVLIRIESEGAYANLALAGAFKRKTLSERDRAFVTALVQGVLRHRLKIDERISKLSSKALDKMPAFLRNALRISVFQIDHMPDIPAPAVVDTCVKAVSAAGHAGLGKFANAVLRNYLRERDKFADGGIISLNVEQYPTSYSMPVWLVEKWLKNWGADETKALLEHTQKIPDLVIRTCELSISVEGLMQLLESRGLKIKRGHLVDSCLIVEDRGAFRGPTDKLPGYAEGLFAIQDEAAAFVSKVVDPRPGELVVDLCAAPGGKSLHLAEMMQNKGRVVAVDSHAGRLNLIRANRQRLGLTNVETFVADGRSFTAGTLADRVLVDAPCTGSGVINRRSDIRFRRQAPDLDRLVELQRQLIAHAGTLVKPGGVLVYSTCSIEPEENEDNIRWFLEENRDFSAESLKDYLPPDLCGRWHDLGYDKDLERGWITLMPSRHGTSGFFVCRLRRSKQ